MTEGDASAARLRADSFWHLYLAEPELVRRRLVPVLEILHPSWQLASLGAALEESLFERAQNPQPLDTAPLEPTWSTTWPAPSSPIEPLPSASCEPPDRSFCRFCKTWIATRLDAEQASRIRAMVDSLGGRATKTRSIESRPGWPAMNRFGLSLLSRAELPRRRLAAKQLSLLVGSPVEFDPSADEAAAQDANRAAASAAASANCRRAVRRGVTRALRPLVPPPGFQRQVPGRRVLALGVQMRRRCPL